MIQHSNAIHILRIVADSRFVIEYRHMPEKTGLTKKECIKALHALKRLGWVKERFGAWHYIQATEKGIEAYRRWFKRSPENWGDIPF